MTPDTSPPRLLPSSGSHPERPPAARRTTRGASVLVGIGLALGLGLAAGAVPAAHALSAVSHGIGYASGHDGRWLGSYRLDDGRLGFCIDVGLAAPPGHEYATTDDVGRSPEDRARLAYVSRRWAGSEDPDTAAAGQLATWSITGLGGHDLSWYAARAGDRAAAVESRARDMLAEAASGASRSVSASASVVLGDDGRGSVRVDLRADLIAGGPTDVPTGSETATVSLDGAVFDDGTASAALPNGTAVPIRATGSGPSVQVAASAAFASLPYGDALDVVGDGGASQGMILARPSDARADARAEARAPSPLPFAPRVVTRTSLPVAAAGDELTDALRVSADPAAPADGDRPATAGGWGLVRASDGGLSPIPVTVRSRLLGPFPEQVGPERDAAPERAPQVCEVLTLVDRGAGDYASPACRLPAGGFYTWVDSISPADTPADRGRDRVLPWRSTFGAATETTQVPQPPTITTTIGEREITTGGCQTDTLRTSSFVGVGAVPVRVRLAGPFAAAPAEGEAVDLPAGPAADGSSSEVELTGEGEVTTPCMSVASPGWYVAVLDSVGRPSGDADGAAIAPFSDHVAHVTETFHAGPPPTGSDVPPRLELAMTGGAPGIDVPWPGASAHAGPGTLAIAAAALGVLGAAGVSARRARRARPRVRASLWARS